MPQNANKPQSGAWLVGTAGNAVFANLGRVWGHVLITMRCHQPGAGGLGKLLCKLFLVSPLGLVIWSARASGSDRPPHNAVIILRISLTSRCSLEHIRNSLFFSCVVNDTIVGKKKSASMFWYPASSAWEPASLCSTERSDGARPAD